MQFLKDDILPEEKMEADKIRKKAPSYWLSQDNNLYRRSFSGPYLLCVHPDQTELLLEEMQRESVETILEAGPWRIGPLLRVIGGRICREKLWSTSKSAINVNGIHRVYTN